MQESINFFFTLLVFVPVNLIAMALVWGLLALLNKVLQLRFSAMTVCAAAGVLVFAMMFAWLDEVDSNRGWVSFKEAPSQLYIFSLALAVINVALAGLISGVVRLYRRGKVAPPPLPVPAQPPTGKRHVAAAVWLVLTLVFGSMPLIRHGGQALADAQNEAYLQKLADIIARNDVPAFQKALAEDPGLWDRELPGVEDGLFDEVIRQDRVEMTSLLLQQNKLLFDYAFDWDLRSPAMADALIAQGMNRDRLALEAVESGNIKLLEHVLVKHRPLFFKWVDTIILIVLREKNEDMLDLLVKHGIAGNAEQVNAALAARIHYKDLEGLKLLVSKGFPLNPENDTIPYLAIYQEHLPILQWLMQHPFDVNGKHDGYTHLEHAIIGGRKDIFDYLLTRNPDVETLHETKRDGMTNALLLAERYKRPELLAALKARVSSRSGAGAAAGNL